MDNDNTSPAYALTKRHEDIACAIYTSAGVCLPENPVVSDNDASIRWVKALWDTGATNSSISDRLAAEMDMPFEDYVLISTAMGNARVPIYPVRLFLPNRVVFDEIEAIEFTYSEDDDCDLIIGMDIMTQGDLAMTNLEGRTVFSFRIPSLHTVDFEAEHTI